jgi:ribosomal-protein-alanine N-acetyltransferase
MSVERWRWIPDQCERPGVMDASFELLTERLRVRPLSPEDVEPLLAILGDPETMRWYPNPFDREGVIAWIDSARQSYQGNGFGLFAVEGRASGEFLGDCGPAIREVDGEAHVELGWHTRRDRWGQGIATEAGGVCRDWCFDTLEVDHLISIISPENRQSWRVAEKIGMGLWKETRYKGSEVRVYRLDRP